MLPRDSSPAPSLLSGGEDRPGQPPAQLPSAPARASSIAEGETPCCCSTRLLTSVLFSSQINRILKKVSSLITCALAQSLFSKQRHKANQAPEDNRFLTAVPRRGEQSAHGPPASQPLPVRGGCRFHATGDPGLPVRSPYHADTALTLPEPPLNHARLRSLGRSRLSSQETEPRETLWKQKTMLRKYTPVTGQNTMLYTRYTAEFKGIIVNYCKKKKNYIMEFFHL